MPTIVTMTNADGPLTLNQADYLGEDVEISNEQTGSSTINLINPSGVTEAFKFYVALRQSLTDLTINIETGTNASLISVFNNQAPPNLATINIGADSSLTMRALSIASGTPININLNKDSVLAFDGTMGSSSTSFGSYSINGLSAGNKITVEYATRVAYEGNNLLFYNEQNRLVARFKAENLNVEDIVFDSGTMSYACYLKGTHIATPNGETKVEALQAGDIVLTASGGLAIVKWIGYRTLYKSRIPSKDAIRAFPITFAKDAIAPNVPHRDLTMSPGHHVFFDGKLIPAMLLVNGKTITQDFSREKFEYFHVELAQFDILLAESVPAESYVDTGNRSMFQNAHTVAMNPDFGPAQGRPVLPGVEVVRAGPTIATIRKRLLKRAEAITNSIRVSDPALRIEIQGQEIPPEVVGQTDGVMRFALPASMQGHDVRILSRSAVVRDTTAHARRDLRTVGVGLARITVEDESGRRDIDLNNGDLSGLHTAQDVNGVTMRWTTGSATIPASLWSRAGKIVLELHVLRTYFYWESVRRAA